MKIKNIVIVLSIVLNLILGTMIFFDNDHDSPTEVGILFKEAVRTENYTHAKRLLAQDRDKYVTEETLKKINEIMSSKTSLQTYELLEFDNGEMVLLNLTPNNEYKIQDVTIVPEEFKSVFR